MIATDTWHSRQALEAACRRAAASAPFGSDSFTTRATVLGGPTLLVDLRDHTIAPHLIRDGFWEAWITLFLARVIKPGMTVVDVGANVGYYTALAAELVGQAGRVFAVEPQARLARLLAQSVRINQWRWVELFEGALAHAPGSGVLTSSVTQRANASLVPGLGPTEGAQKDRVDVTTLDLLTLSRKPDLIKIDAEGGELAIWHGMGEALDEGAAVLMEVRADRYENPRGFLSEIRGHCPDVQAVGFDGLAHPIEDETILGRPHEDFMLWLGR